MFKFKQNKQKNYGLSNLWMNTLQEREEKKKARLEPQIVQEVAQVQHVESPVIAPQPAFVVHEQQTIVTRQELMASQEEKQLHSLHEEVASLPGNVGLAFA
jgi:hypothetical protein